MQRLLQASGLRYSMHSAGTTVGAYGHPFLQQTYSCQTSLIPVRCSSPTDASIKSQSLTACLLAVLVKVRLLILVVQRAPGTTS